MQALVTHGPLYIGFQVLSSFTAPSAFTYTDYIYMHDNATGTSRGGHAVCIYGWGTSTIKASGSSTGSSSTRGARGASPAPAEDPHRAWPRHRRHRVAWRVDDSSRPLGRCHRPTKSRTTVSAEPAAGAAVAAPPPARRRRRRQIRPAAAASAQPPAPRPRWRSADPPSAAAARGAQYAGTTGRQHGLRLGTPEPARHPTCRPFNAGSDDRRYRGRLCHRPTAREIRPRPPTRWLPAHHRPRQYGTRRRGGSVDHALPLGLNGKTFMGIIASRLAVAGTLDLDADIRTYYPAYTLPSTYYVCPDGGPAWGLKRSWVVDAAEPIDQPEAAAVRLLLCRPALSSQ